MEELDIIGDTWFPTLTLMPTPTWVPRAPGTFGSADREGGRFQADAIPDREVGILGIG